MIELEKSPKKDLSWARRSVNIGRALPYVEWALFTKEMVVYYNQIPIISNF